MPICLNPRTLPSIPYSILLGLEACMLNVPGCLARAFWSGSVSVNHWQPERRSHPRTSSSRGGVSLAIPAVAIAAAAAGYLPSKVPALPEWALD